MPEVDIGEAIKWVAIAFIVIITAWEKAKRWHYRRAGKDRRSSNPNLETKVQKLCQAFKMHEKNDEQRAKDFKDELWHLREQQSRHTASIGKLTGRMNSR